MEKALSFERKAEMMGKHLTETIWVHSLNRNEGGSILKHGAFWINWPGWQLSFEWVLFRFNFALSLTSDDEGLHFHIAIPYLISLFVKSDYPRITRKYRGKLEDLKREISIRIFCWAIWLELWGDPDGYGPRRQRVFHIDDFFLGRSQYSQRPITEERISVQMPEGLYRGVVSIYEATWKRPRWPWHKRMIRSDLDMDDPIPIPGKGENSWDLEDTAIHSLTGAYGTAEAAIEGIQKSAMRDRERYGGKDWRPEVSA